MPSFEIILLLIGCLLASSVFGQVLPRVSLPLVQIALGAIVGCFVTTDPTQVFRDPELFLVLFIAPLLFEESRHADKRALLRAWAPIASLAIGLIVVTSLACGAALHLAAPAIPLAAAFALGAALGPTDAAAVTAMGADVSLTRRQKSLLSGEALFNDASGVVCFEFAVAAATTGEFSATHAAATFAQDFIGGIVVGLVLGALITLIVAKVRDLGLETPTEHVLFEVLTPFVTFLAAEELGVSGILAVVAAGLLMRFSPRGLTPEASRHALASESVWDLLTFSINGTLFVLLGMKLPGTIGPIWRVSQGADAAAVCGLVLLATLIVVGIRLAWVLALEWVHRHRHAEEYAGTGTAALVRSALVTCLSGPKGAVTLSIMLTLPYLTDTGAAFPQRSLLIFVASGVILLTLLLANFLVPLLAPASDSPEADEALARVREQILRAVLDELATRATPETRAATRLAMRSYRERIDAVLEVEASAADLRDLRLRVLDGQIGFVRDLAATGKADAKAAARYAGALEQLRGAYGLHRGASGGRGRRRAHVLRVSRALRGSGDAGERRELARIHRAAEQHAIDELAAMTPQLTDEQRVAARIISGEHRAHLAMARDGLAGDAVPGSRREALKRRDSIRAQALDVEAEGLALELEHIRRLRDAGELSTSAARELREEVYLLQMGLDAR